MAPALIWIVLLGLKRQIAFAGSVPDWSVKVPACPFAGVITRE